MDLDGFRGFEFDAVKCDAIRLRMVMSLDRRKVANWFYHKNIAHGLCILMKFVTGAYWRMV